MEHFNTTYYNTLFLDRDGVLNHQKEGGYIESWDEFIFYDEVLDALKILSARFTHIFIVTNQRGVGRGLMTEEVLQQIHQKMLHRIQDAGGRIDGIYYCTAVDNTNYCRKPNIGMAFEASKDFPSITFNRAVMVGNSCSDMEFGRGIGAYTVFLTTTQPNVALPDTRIDLVCNSLYEFAQSLQSLR